jgi:outer membrane protein assembly factor BamA
MKKMFFALVAMVMMTMSANAQSFDNNSKVTFDQLSSYLELTSNQIEPTKTAMAQFENSMQAYYQLQDASKAGVTWEKIQARHKATMKNMCCFQITFDVCPHVFRRLSKTLANL